MLKRVLSGIVALAIIIPGIIYPFTSAMLLIICAWICLWEYGKFSFSENCGFWMFFLMLTPVVISSHFLTGNFASSVLIVPLYIVWTIIIAMRSYATELEKFPAHLALATLGVCYIAFPFGFLYLIRKLTEGHLWIFIILTGTFMGDTGAYFTGRFFGKHKLAPRISPNKTWEGFVGQILGAFLGVFLMQRFFGPISMTFGDILAIGAICGVLGALGDLFESMLKRGFGVKDSGGIMPGHGGLLDRVDGLLFTGPAVYYYLTAFHHS